MAQRMIEPDGITVDILDLVFEERGQQSSRDRVFDCANPSTRLTDAIAVLGEEFGEAAREALEMTVTPAGTLGISVNESLRDELVQVAAVATAMAEACQRRIWEQRR